MSDEVELSMTLPLDSDGFLRRECPTCERELKWLYGSEGSDDVAPVPDGGYFCPYCGVQAPPESWLTQAQAALARNVVATEFLGPEIEKFGREISRSSSSSGGISISASIKYEGPEKMDPLTEAEDMKRVNFACHPSEPVKVLDAWTGSVHCLLCGAATDI